MPSPDCCDNLSEGFPLSERDRVDVAESIGFNVLALSTTPHSRIVDSWTVSQAARHHPRAARVRRGITGIRWEVAL